MVETAVRGLRGATVASANTPEAIGAATKELVQALLAENDIDLESIASIIFTVTGDLDAQFPALAARELGLHQVPLLCAREIDVPGRTTAAPGDRKSTRLNSSHVKISYAVFCLKKKKQSAPRADPH